jgi:hypothetical protein
MLMPRNQNAGQNHDIEIANRSFETMTKVRYLGTAVTNERWIHKEINSTLILDNACYSSVKKPLSSRLPSKNFTIKIYEIIIILPVGLYAYETWSLTLGEGHRLGMFVNSVLRRRFGPMLG